MYTIKEIAKILKLHPITVYRFVENGKIKAEKVGKHWRITEEQIKEIMVRGV